MELPTPGLKCRRGRTRPWPRLVFNSASTPEYPGLLCRRLWIRHGQRNPVPDVRMPPSLWRCQISGRRRMTIVFSRYGDDRCLEDRFCPVLSFPRRPSNAAEKKKKKKSSCPAQLVILISIQNHRQTGTRTILAARM